MMDAQKDGISLRRGRRYAKNATVAFINQIQIKMNACPARRGDFKIAREELFVMPVGRACTMSSPPSLAASAAHRVGFSQKIPKPFALSVQEEVIWMKKANRFAKIVLLDGCSL